MLALCLLESVACACSDVTNPLAANDGCVLSRDCSAEADLFPSASYLYYKTDEDTLANLYADGRGGELPKGALVTTYQAKRVSVGTCVGA